MKNGKGNNWWWINGIDQTKYKTIYSLDCPACKGKIEGESNTSCKDAYIDHVKNKCPVIKLVEDLKRAGLTRKDFEKLRKANLFGKEKKCDWYART